uniref:Elongation of very long chain fatty acids protein n=1 Tax=Calidris pygmaea TaxID=425635 RepID=A0A8C3PPR5_9CHAR
GGVCDVTSAPAKLGDNTTLPAAYPRTDPWPLVHSPLPVTLLFAFYLFVVALGPFYMRQRKPLKLRGLLIVYNLAMMTLSSYMFYEVRRQDWLLGKHLASA